MTTVELHGGPCDGEELDISLIPDDEISGGVALPSPGCRYPGGRSFYSPDVNGTWRWDGDVP